MRRTFDPQPLLGAIPIESLTFDPKSRDDTEVLCTALQALWCDRETRDAVLELIEKSHSDGINCGNGRPGMDVWQIRVFAVAKQGLDIDCDRRTNLASNHMALRSLAGLSNCLDPLPISAAPLANTIALLDAEVLDKINPAIVQLGHKAVGHSMDAGLQARGDRFVVETDGAYPTDLRLLWDAIRAATQQPVRLGKLLGVAGWRQAKHWQKVLKKAWQKARRIRRPHTLYATVIRTYLKRADHLIRKRADMRIELERAHAGLLLQKSDAYVDYAHRLRDQVERRVIHGETIPQEDKIFSVFEPHTRWIAKGKAGTPVELGVPVCVIEDQYQFILGHQILWEGGDRDGIVSCIQTLQEHYPTLQELSLDKGFWSPTVYEELASTLALVALPKKGRRTAVEREREQAPAFAAARQQHPAIESAINMLEHHGLQRIRSFGADGFSRMVGLSIIAANLVRVGRLLRDKERARLERLHRRAA